MGHYTKKALHPIRYMEKYIAEIQEGTNRPNELKKRFADVKKIAHSMYTDAFEMINVLDEDGNPSDFFWKKSLEKKKISYMGKDCPYGDYSVEKLHPIRHFGKYKQEVCRGNFSDCRRNELKEKLGIVLELSVQLYYDAERLIRTLDGE